MGDSQDNVQVYIRVRPLSEGEISEDHKSAITCTPTSLRLLREDGDSREFSFDRIFSQETPQEEMFKQSGQKLVEAFLGGYNVTMFVYGQTGAGKTYTMIGNTEDPEGYGLMPRALEYLFFLLQERKDEHLVKVSFVEIYNEKIHDLLSDEQTVLQIREDIRKGVFLEGSREEVVSSISEAKTWMKRGQASRRIAETKMNSVSSRSHAIFTVTLQSVQNENQCASYKNSSFHFVDLAGSERVRAANTAGDRLKEGCSINKSLSVLGNVINALAVSSKGKKMHVRYRDSKLTFLLKSALGGNAKTLFIANISPVDSQYVESLGTLMFAQRAKLIKNSAKVNEDFKGESLAAVSEELRRAKDELRALQEKFTVLEKAGIAAAEAGASERIRKLEAKVMEKSAALRESVGLLRKCLKSWETQLVETHPDQQESLLYLKDLSGKVMRLGLTLKLELLGRDPRPEQLASVELRLLLEERKEDQRNLKICRDELVKLEERLEQLGTPARIEGPETSGSLKKDFQARLEASELLYEQAMRETQLVREENEALKGEIEIMDEKLKMLRIWNEQTLEDKKALTENLEKIRYEKFALMKRFSEEFEFTKNKNDELVNEVDIVTRERDLLVEGVANLRTELEIARKERKFFKTEAEKFKEENLGLVETNSRLVDLEARLLAAEEEAHNSVARAESSQAALAKFEAFHLENSRASESLHALLAEPRGPALTQGEVSTHGAARLRAELARSRAMNQTLAHRSREFKAQAGQFFQALIKIREGLKLGADSMFDSLVVAHQSQEEALQLRSRVADLENENKTLKKTFDDSIAKLERKLKPLALVSASLENTSEVFRKAYLLKHDESMFYKEELLRRRENPFFQPEDSASLEKEDLLREVLTLREENRIMGRKLRLSMEMSHIRGDELKENKGRSAFKDSNIQNSISKRIKFT